MYEVSLEILKLNLEEFKKLRGKDVALTRAKYQKAVSMGSKEAKIQEKMAVMGVMMAWEERISDISDAISALEAITNEEDEINGTDENGEPYCTSSYSAKRSGGEKNESEYDS